LRASEQIARDRLDNILRPQPAIGAMAVTAVDPFAGGIVLENDHGVAEFVGRQTRRGI
jgi:hypothetical protein